MRQRVEAHNKAGHAHQATPGQTTIRGLVVGKFKTPSMEKKGEAYRSRSVLMIFKRLHAGGGGGKREKGQRGIVNK